MATANITTQPFVADRSSIDRLNGASIDWATVTGVDQFGIKMIKAGTIMSRETNGFAPASDAATDVCAIIETDAYNNDQSPAALSGYGMIVGGVIYENLLPDNADASFATWQAALVSAGTGFAFLTYGDSRDTST